MFCPYRTTAINLKRNPPPQLAYSTLQQKIIKRNSESGETRLQKLLEYQATNETPSDTYNRLVEFAAETTNTKFLVKIVSMRLPMDIRLAIESQMDKPFDKILEIANSLYEKMENNRRTDSINRPGTSSRSTEESRLLRIEKQLAV